MPSMTPAVVKGLIEKRPFASITELNAYLLSQKLTQEQAKAFYGKAFVHINLNSATAEEILLVPNAGKRMAHEFEEYRPWRTYAQFDKEIGKYVGAGEDREAGAVHLHPGQAEHRHRCRHPLHPRRRRAHGEGVQGISALEDQGAVHQRDRQVPRSQGRGTDVEIRGYRIGFKGFQRFRGNLWNPFSEFYLHSQFDDPFGRNPEEGRRADGVARHAARTAVRATAACPARFGREQRLDAQEERRPSRSIGKSRRRRAARSAPARPAPP